MPNQNQKPSQTQKTNQNHQTLRDQIGRHLETLKISVTPEQIDEFLREATKSKPSYLELLERFLQAPANQRRERSIARRLQRANFRDPGTLESFDWKFNEKTIDPAPFRELATGDFVRRRDNIAFVGESGLGKSHLIQSIGRCCCVLGHRVRYVTSAQLLEELTAASGDRTLAERVRYYGRFDLVIIDEFGFDKLERLEYPESPSLLYKIIDHRNGRGSTAMVTNIDFKEWTDYLGDPPLAMALLDRVVDGAIIQRFEGKSYRAHRAEQKSKQKLSSRSKTSKSSS
jgi:DNA replication protein DnaC